MTVDKRSLVLSCLLVFAVLAVFGRGIFHQFVNFDDNLFIVDNSHLWDESASGFLDWAFTSTEHGNWHPLTWFSHRLDADVFGRWPGGHHLTSVILHALSAAALFLTLLRLTGTTGKSLFVSSLFALHPLHVESVAWVSERKDVLSGLLFTLTLLAYTRYVRKRDLGSYLTVAGLFALGLMSKPMVVTLPIVLLLLDWWPLGRLSVPPPTGGLAGFFRRNRALVLEKLPLLALSGVVSGITYWAQQSYGAVNDLEAISVKERLLNAVVSYGTYLAKTAWPSRLAFFYPLRSHTPPLEALAAGGVLALLTAGAVLTAKRRPWLFTGWFWYLVMLAPVIGVVQVGTQSLADRYTYLPLTGIFIAIAWGAAPRVSGLASGRIALPAGLALLAALGTLSFIQTGYWRDSFALTRRGLAVTTANAVAHNNLAAALLETGNQQEAILHFEEALRIDPNHAQAKFNLGALLLKRGDLRRAEPLIREALALDPKNSQGWSNLGNILLRTGRAELAVPCLLQAIRLRPDYALASFNLGATYLALGQHEDAIEAFRAGLRHAPNDARAHKALGGVLRDLGRTAEASREFAEAVRLDPGAAEATTDRRRNPFTR
jgi:Flp pilus assembly protein TadD